MWFRLDFLSFWGFHDSSVSKESASNAGDPCSIPGLERSTGEGIGYPLQCGDPGSTKCEGTWTAPTPGLMALAESFFEALIAGNQASLASLSP